MEVIADDASLAHLLEDGPELARILDEEKLVLVRGRQLAARDVLALGERLGSVIVDPFVASLPGLPGVIRIVREADETGFVFAVGWHSDWSFLEDPPTFTMLYAVDVPALGGTTAWADMRRVFDFLSEPLQAVLRQAGGVHSGAQSFAPDGSYAQAEAKKSMTVTPSETARRRVVHPCVSVDAATGRSALYVNSGYTIAFDGWTEAESQPLLKFLFELTRWEEFTTRHQWRNGDLVLWDNRVTCHRAVGDYQGVRRELLRSTVRWPHRA